MRIFISLLLALMSFASYGQGSTVYLRADTVSVEKTGGNAELRIKNATRTRTGAFLVNYGNGITGFKYAIDSAWKSGDSIRFRLGPGNLAVFAGGTGVDTMYRDDLAFKWVKGGVTYTLADAFKNLETSDLLLPTNRIIDLDGNALVFSDGSTHYDFEGGLMTLYIASGAYHTEIQQSATNVNIAVTDPDNSAAFSFGADLITMGINGDKVQVTPDSLISLNPLRAKTFQTETGKVKVLDGGVVVQDEEDVTVSYLIGRNVGGHVFDMFGIASSSVTPIATGGSVYLNTLDSLRPSFMNSAGVSKRFLLQGDAIGSSDATKLNISDTAAMLAAYLRKIDTAAMLLGYQKRCHLQTLTDAATVTWNYATSCEAIVTLAGNRTLSITNLPSNYVSYGTLTVLQDATGSRTLAMPATSKVSSNGAGVITLTTTGNARDVISFRYLPTLGIFEWTYGKNFN